MVELWAAGWCGGVFVEGVSGLRMAKSVIVVARWSRMSTQKK